MKTLVRISKLLKAYNAHCLNEIYFQENKDYMEASLEDHYKHEIFHQLVELELLHPIKFWAVYLIFGSSYDKEIIFKG